jgi:DNA-binding beta-propeller fold protein YncE
VAGDTSTDGDPLSVARRAAPWRRRWLGAAVVAVALTLGCATLASAAGPTPTQTPGTAGCIAQAGHAGCAVGRAMAEPFEAPAISPDGRNAYLLAADPGRIDVNALDVLDRDPTTGALTQKPGAEGCLSTTGKAGCALDPLLEGADQVAISPDGADVYVSTESGVVGFARDATTGALSALPPPGECLGGVKVRAPCTAAVGLKGAAALAFSPDGGELYVTSDDRATVAILRRDPATGALSQGAGVAGCITLFGKTHRCGGKTPDGVADEIVAGPDGRDVYVTGFDEAGHEESVVNFRRDADGSLHRAAGRTSCLAAKGRGGCGVARGFAGISGIALSPDGLSLYISSDQDGSGGTIAIFDRAPSGALTQRAGKAACLSATYARECTIAKGARTTGEVVVSPDGSTVYADTVVGIGIFARAPSGLLTAIEGPAGCLSDFKPTCTKVRNLEAPSGLALTPDGSQLLATAGEPGGLSVFTR